MQHKLFSMFSSYMFHIPENMKKFPLCTLHTIIAKFDHDTSPFSSNIVVIVNLLFESVIVANVICIDIILI